MGTGFRWPCVEAEWELPEGGTRSWMRKLRLGNREKMFVEERAGRAV